MSSFQDSDLAWEGCRISSCYGYDSYYSRGNNYRDILGPYYLRIYILKYICAFSCACKLKFTQFNKPNESLEVFRLRIIRAARQGRRGSQIGPGK